MEKSTESSQTEKEEDKKYERKLQKHKTVNWRRHSLDEIKIFSEENKKITEDSKSVGKKSAGKKAQNQLSIKPIGKDAFIEIEVIDKDGKAFKKIVKDECEGSEEFLKKRRKSNHGEYAKCREYLKTHPDGEDEDED